MNKRIASMLAPLLLTLAPVASAAAPVTFSAGNTELTVDGEISPVRLPSDRFETAGMTVSTRISTADGNGPPALQRLLLGVDRSLRFDFQGIAACRAAPNPRGSLEVPGCRSAVVGTGHTELEFGFQSREPVCCGGKTIVYNGGLVGGRRRLWLRFTGSVPQPGIGIASLDVRRVSSRRFPTRLVFSFAATPSDGVLRSLQFRLLRGVLGACPTGTRRFLATGVFADGTRPSGQLARSCQRR